MLMAAFPSLRKYEQELRDFRSQKRQAERLAARALLCDVLGESATICYTPEGRPYLADATANQLGAQHLSISDTGPFVALSLSAEPHGIDIERYDPRALKLAPRFLSDSECSEFSLSARTATLLWSAKEAVFKRLEQQEGLTVSHIVLSRESDEMLRATVPGHPQPVRVGYAYMPDFVLTYTLD